METLVKILKLEREQGCKNQAVIGGLDAYGRNWGDDARKAARKPEHHRLIDELIALMGRYEQIENRADRTRTVNYMIDRIMGRVPAPPEYQVQPGEAASTPQAPATDPETARPGEGGRQRADRPPRDQREPRAKDDRPDDDRRRDAERRPDRNRAQENRPRHDHSEQLFEPATEAPSEHRAVYDEGEGAAERPAETQARDHAPTGRKAPERRQSPTEKPVRQDRPERKSKPARGNRSDSQRKEYRSPSIDSRREEPRPAAYEPEFENSSYDDPDGGHNRRGGDYARTAEPDIRPLPKLARPPRKPRPLIDPQEAADINRGLKAPVLTVKGIGPRMAESLDRLGIRTINDMLYNLPRRYDDYTRMDYISRLLPGQTVSVMGVVRFTEVRVGRTSRRDFYLELDDGSGILSVIFFGQHFLVRSIRKDLQIVVSGDVTRFGHRLQMVNPEWEEVDPENLRTPGIVPVYRLTEGLGAKSLRRLMDSTVEYWAEHIQDYMPEAVLERAELADLGWTIKNLHFPAGWDHLHHARRRYAFDQLFALQLAILANRRDWQSVPAQPILTGDDFLEPFLETVFPYPLTGAQRRAIEDIRRDIANPIPMNRLLQGDVGSGKTAVAITALAMTFANGRQAALMAPTSILAEQHYRGISRALEGLPAALTGERRPVIGLLTGSLSTGERESIYRGLADGSIDIIIGTHALIQSGVEFNDLALAVIDEQHRFGVEQRGALRGKGTNPHLLVMTATPIPRTLALTLYADLDLSVMDEMPPGRTPIATRIVQPVERERIYGFIQKQVSEGRQAFVVYPLVEASEGDEGQSENRAATEAFEHLKKVFFRHRVGLLHGRMKPSEKDQVMADFSEHKFDILVTTSVAEVGVDVPNATVIVIEGANRFGLAQLHQFRGRVGRGQFPSYCLLIPDAETPEALERLAIMEATSDGFMLAEYDWKLRGAGDLVGTRQSGKVSLQLAEFVTPELTALAQREARTLYEEDPYLQDPAHLLLAQRVTMVRDEDSDIS
jgi:ATP-dependent DNA helicase RecG